MKTITVASTKRDTEVFGVQKYDNDEFWNVPGGMAPNGVCATRRYHTFILVQRKKQWSTQMA